MIIQCFKVGMSLLSVSLQKYRNANSYICTLPLSSVKETYTLSTLLLSTSKKRRITFGYAFEYIIQFEPFMVPWARGGTYLLWCPNRSTWHCARYISHGATFQVDNVSPLVYQFYSLTPCLINCNPLRIKLH